VHESSKSWPSDVVPGGEPWRQGEQRKKIAARAVIGGRPRTETEGRDGKEGRRHREVPKATAEGKPLKDKAHGRYGMKQGREGMSGAKRQEVEKT
jgi:hypothetical protein